MLRSAGDGQNLPDGAHAGIFPGAPDAEDVIAVILDGMRPRPDGEPR